MCTAKNTDTNTNKCSFCKTNRNYNEKISIIEDNNDNNDNNPQTLPTESDNKIDESPQSESTDTEPEPEPEPEVDATDHELENECVNQCDKEEEIETSQKEQSPQYTALE